MHFEATSSQQPLSPTKKTSRAALALNNTAVSLMERGCFKESLHTLMDSVEMMKLALVFDTTVVAEEAITTELALTTTTPTIPAADIVAVDQRLDLASKRIAVVCCQQSSQEAATCFNTELTEIACLDDDDIGLLKAAGNYASSSTIAFPIRLRDSSMNDSLNGEGADAFQTSVIFYNRGLACLLYYEHQQRRARAKGKVRSSLSNKLLVGAFKFFSISHAMMIRYLKDHHPNGHQEHDQSRHDSTTGHEKHHERLRALLITRLILGKLFQVIRYQNQTQRHIQGMLDSLVIVDDAVIRLEKMMLGSVSHHALFVPRIAAAA